MNTTSLNNLWNYLEGLSLSASNQRWLGERLINASNAKISKENENQKQKILDSLYGAWKDVEDADRIEKAINDCHQSGYERIIEPLED